MCTTRSRHNRRHGTTVAVFGIALSLAVLPVLVVCVTLAISTGLETLRLSGSGSAAATARYATAFGLLVLASAALIASVWWGLRSHRRGDGILQSLRWPLLALPPAALGMLVTVWAVQP